MYELTYKKTQKKLEGYADADWWPRSYTGYIFLLGGSALSLEARKQRTVALSSTEAEYMALWEGAKQVIYLRCFLQQLGVEPSQVLLYDGNHGAGDLVKNPV